MHGLTPDRRPRRDRRRKQIRRRRAGALVIVATLSLLAVWLAYALPAATPARVPAAAAQPTFAEKMAVDRRVVVATLGDVEILLPVALEHITAIGYHAAESPEAVAFAPEGDCVSGGGLAQKLADIFKGGGGLAYYLMSDDGDGAAATGALDVGAVPGAEVFSPVDGKVVSLEKTEIAGKYKDVEIQIQVANDPTLVLVVTHIADVAVELGDGVTQGDTLLGRVRSYPEGVTQELSHYTSDAGDHVQFVALRVNPDIAGL
jgi:hypothetical protein